MSSNGSKCSSTKLEDIKEDGAASWLPASCHPPETPTESMEFLARAWSLSATELSKALCNTNPATKTVDQKVPLSSCSEYTCKNSVVTDESQTQAFPIPDSPPVSPRGSDDSKELFLLHQALNPDFLSSQQLLRNGLYRSIMKGKTMGRRLKDQKERKKQEARAQKAQLHAAVSVAGVAAAVAALTTSSVTSPERSTKELKKSSKASSAIASAAALVASHCIELAEDMGAEHEQILSAVNSAINARTNGDIMTLTAGAATALRGAATLKARLHKGCEAGSIALPENYSENIRESNCSPLSFVTTGGELLKRTRKGDLHWKQVSFNMNSNWQVVVKMKSKHMGGTFTKKKKCIVSGIYCDIQPWPGREREDTHEQKSYFGIKTADRIIEFECRNKGAKQMWVDGIQHMLHCRMNRVDPER